MGFIVHVVSALLNRYLFFVGEEVVQDADRFVLGLEAGIVMSDRPQIPPLIFSRGQNFILLLV
jgi:hypothetical protein